MTSGSRYEVMQPAKAKKRVVVTGLGVVSGCGIGHKAFFSNLLEGTSSIGKISESTIPGIDKFPCQIGSEVTDFDPKEWFANKKSVNSNDRYTHFGVAATKMAMADARLTIGSMDGMTGGAIAERVGVMVGSAFGGMGTFERETLKLSEKGPKRVSPFTIPALLGNTAAGIIGIEVGARGPNFGIVSACASGTHCIGEALGVLQDGEADVMIAGGAEAAITPLSFAGFCAMKAMNTGSNDDPGRASRPFDAERAGFVMGEGAGILVLETLEHAEARGAKIYCELAGYGATCDAHHITTPEPTGAGLAGALEKAIEMSGILKTEVAYINAHGTSTKYNDKFETMAIKRVFGDHANSLHISSTKGATGHTLGAAGGIEAVVACKSIETSTLPPTINYENPDSDCDLSYVPNSPLTLPEVKAAISDNLGFGGHNGALLFTKFDS